MKRAHDDDYPEAKRLSKHVLQDRQRKLRLVRAGALLEDHIPIPDVRTLILEYSNEFDGVTVMARDQEQALSLLSKPDGPCASWLCYQTANSGRAMSRLGAIEFTCGLEIFGPFDRLVFVTV
jgi:hypothetical protein